MLSDGDNLIARNAEFALYVIFTAGLRNLLTFPFQMLESLQKVRLLSFQTVDVGSISRLDDLSSWVEEISDIISNVVSHDLSISIIPAIRPSFENQTARIEILDQEVLTVRISPLIAMSWIGKRTIVAGRHFLGESLKISHCLMFFTLDPGSINRKIYVCQNKLGSLEGYKLGFIAIHDYNTLQRYEGCEFRRPVTTSSVI